MPLALPFLYHAELFAHECCVNWGLKAVSTPMSSPSIQNYEPGSSSSTGSESSRIRFLSIGESTESMKEAFRFPDEIVLIHCHMEYQGVIENVPSRRLVMAPSKGEEGSPSGCGVSSSFTSSSSSFSESITAWGSDSDKRARDRNLFLVVGRGTDATDDLRLRVDPGQIFK